MQIVLTALVDSNKRVVLPDKLFRYLKQIATKGVCRYIVVFAAV